MNRKHKIIAGIVVVLAVLVVTVAVVSILTLTTKHGVAGTYTGDNGSREITLTKDGTFTHIPISSGISEPATLRYWVSGNKITTGVSTSRLSGIDFEVERNNRLIGWGSTWVKVKPNRPPSLVGTYTASDRESLALDKSGAAYDSQQSQNGGSVRGGTWVAGKNVVTAIFLTEKTTYTINGKNLVGQSKEFVRTSDSAVVPITP